MAAALAKTQYGNLNPQIIDQQGMLDQLLINTKRQNATFCYDNTWNQSNININWPFAGTCENKFDFAGQYQLTMQLNKKGERYQNTKLP